MNKSGRAGKPRGAPGEDGRRSRWRAHRETRRAAIVDAAIRAIRTRGADVSMEDIAVEAGVTKPILYRHFTDKADLYVAVGRRLAEELLARLAQELEHAREPREHIAAVIDTYLGAIEAEPELYRFLIRRSFADQPAEHDPVADYSTMIANRVARAIGDRLRERGLDSGCAEPWGHGLVGLVQSAGNWWLDRRLMSRAALTEYLTALIWGGFAGALAAAGPAPGPAAVRPLRAAGDRPGEERPGPARWPGPGPRPDRP
ncbi:TetR family transcriptional regulator [Carbonactinospora thermoautotrophica]|uniref:TetR/AcrR family transcriptional regulator n=1 Tax=Carbonactinospora thermoautotrophica TaxID=1469144 RepID=UPI00226DD74E|nr:TetR/AcrR family transcriptional regulator [Carbonactinospora thermoautotrophica]MCX9193751.1 TetR family transcriptional regulator [Carbonactinospora thermoautotrophica]